MNPPGPSPFLDACSGRMPPWKPVWFMRQAGRSLPEYRALRGGESILEAVRHPELAAEVTLQPVHRYGVDAAILFSD
ncbi:MAG: uroporphyrinogen decarboxylase family protein, partial [Acidimicrobiales bacterium]